MRCSRRWMRRPGGCGDSSPGTRAEWSNGPSSSGPTPSPSRPPGSVRPSVSAVPTLWWRWLRIRSTPLVTVFVDAALAGETNGEAGAALAAGPRVGPAVLERILCEGAIQVVAVADGVPVVASAATRTIPPAIRRFVLWRDGGCVADGCRSRKDTPGLGHWRSRGVANWWVGFARSPAGQNRSPDGLAPATASRESR